jgi:hypothetical protein
MLLFDLIKSHPILMPSSTTLLPEAAERSIVIGARRRFPRQAMAKNVTLV